MSIEKARLALLKAEIETELESPEFSSRTHGRISCYNAGCRGPLCRYVNSCRVRDVRGSVSRMDPWQEQMLIEMLNEGKKLIS